MASNCLQKMKRIKDSNTSNKDILSGYRIGIWHRKMCHSYKKKCEKRDNGRNRTAKSRKNQNARRKENLKVQGILEVDTIKQVKMKEKIKIKNLRRTRKLLETKLCIRNLIKVINTWGPPPCNILRTILKMDEGIIQTNGPVDKKTNDDE